MPPTVPTSFVPHPTTGGAFHRGNNFSFTGILAALAYLFLILALLSAGGVFIYGRILASEQASKDAQLATAESSLNQATIQQFLRLRDRLTSAQTLLNNHVALSGVFNLLEQVTPDNVRFSSVSITDTSGVFQLQAPGTAKSFNTLAIASSDFGMAAQLKDVIFSNITLGAGGTVSFLLSATIDPSLVAYTAPSSSAGTSAPTTSSAPSGSTAAPQAPPLPLSTASSSTSTSTTP